MSSHSSEAGMILFLFGFVFFLYVGSFMDHTDEVMKSSPMSSFTPGPRGD